MDFSWFYFIGSKKLNLTMKETGRLTLTIFGKLYQHYKDDFDLELKLRLAETTYKKVEQDSNPDKEWF